MFFERTVTVLQKEMEENQRPELHSCAHFCEKDKKRITEI
jgi:hypothetical protein